MFLPYEVLQLIALDVNSYSNFMSFKLSCKELYNTLNIEDCFTNVFDNNISKFCDADKFSQWLTDNNAYVAGSFILNCFNPSKYKCSDIDIFIQYNEYSYFEMPYAMFSYYEEELCHILNIELKDIIFFPDVHEKRHQSENNTRIFTENIHAVHNILLNGIKIDIVVTEINPLEFIKTSFDLDCCQRAYNGKNLYAPHYNIGETKIVRMSNVYDKYHNNDNGLPIIIKLISTINSNLLPDNVKIIYNDIVKSKNNDLYYLKLYRLFYRCLKYMIKGITIINFKDYFYYLPENKNYSDVTDYQ
jgi:hypothetical protein